MFYDHYEAQKKAQILIDAMNRKTAELLKSTEATRQFLIDAGIIKDKKKRRSSTKAK